MVENSGLPPSTALERVDTPIENERTRLWNQLNQLPDTNDPDYDHRRFELILQDTPPDILHGEVTKLIDWRTREGNPRHTTHENVAVLLLHIRNANPLALLGEHTKDIVDSAKTYSTSLDEKKNFDEGMERLFVNSLQLSALLLNWIPTHPDFPMTREQVGQQIGDFLGNISAIGMSVDRQNLGVQLLDSILKNMKEGENTTTSLKEIKKGEDTTALLRVMLSHFPDLVPHEEILDRSQTSTNQEMVKVPTREPDKLESEMLESIMRKHPILFFEAFPSFAKVYSQGEMMSLGLNVETYFEEAAPNIDRIAEAFTNKDSFQRLTEFIFNHARPDTIFRSTAAFLRAYEGNEAELEYLFGTLALSNTDAALQQLATLREAFGEDSSIISQLPAYIERVVSSVDREKKEERLTYWHNLPQIQELFGEEGRSRFEDCLIQMIHKDDSLALVNVDFLLKILGPDHPGITSLRETIRNKILNNRQTPYDIKDSPMDGQIDDYYIGIKYFRELFGKGNRETYDLLRTMIDLDPLHAAARCDQIGEVVRDEPYIYLAMMRQIGQRGGILEYALEDVFGSDKLAVQITSPILRSIRTVFPPTTYPRTADALSQYGNYVLVSPDTVISFFTKIFPALHESPDVKQALTASSLNDADIAVAVSKALATIPRPARHPFEFD